jgi:hypothetical protein
VNADPVSSLTTELGERTCDELEPAMS